MDDILANLVEAGQFFAPEDARVEDRIDWLTGRGKYCKAVSLACMYYDVPENVCNEAMNEAMGMEAKLCRKTGGFWKAKKKVCKR